MAKIQFTEELDHIFMDEVALYNPFKKSNTWQGLRAPDKGRTHSLWNKNPKGTEGQGHVADWQKEGRKGGAEKIVSTVCRDSASNIRVDQLDVSSASGCELLRSAI